MASTKQTAPVIGGPDLHGAGWRWIVSFLLLIHLAAVFLPPFSLATSSPGTSSPLAALCMRIVRPYVDAAFLNHGYAFFAPDPGPSHLVRCDVEYGDGRAPEQFVFPDLKRQWPRLLYHRHFMLSEQLHGKFVPSRPPAPSLEEADPARQEEILADWQNRRAVYEAQRRSFERHLLSSLNASRVTVTRIEHRLMTPGEFLARGTRLDHPDLYLPLSDDARGEELP